MTQINENDESNVDQSSGTSSLSPEVKAFIKREIENQLRSLVREILVPELRKAILESVQTKAESPDLELQKQPSNSLQPVNEEILPLVEEESLPVKASPKFKPDEDKPKLSIADIRIGIDFGTSTTAVSLRIGEEQPQALPIGRNGEKYIPSVAYFRAGTGDLSERVLVGEEAEAINDEMRVIRSIKRCFECEGIGCSLRIDKKSPWCIGDGRIQINEKDALLPSEIAFFIIKEALTRAMNVIKEMYNPDFDISSIGLAPVNIGCGANFNLAQRKIIFETLKSFGFNNVSINNVVEEPILAGFAFSRFAESAEGRSVIYDFGGGTLDIAVIDVSRKDGKPFVTVLATAGENWLGGDDIDEIVYKEFVTQIEIDLGAKKGEVEKLFEPIDHIKLRQKAKFAKERLSSLDAFEDSLLLEQLGMARLSLTRSRFEEILEEAGIVDKSMEAMLRTFKLTYALEVAQESDMLDLRKVVNLHFPEAASNIARIILVGGVTKIPYIQNKIKGIFGEQKVVEEKVFEPISAVSIGAAYPKEADHFSISAPPYGFYLEGKQNGQAEQIKLILPYAYLEFYRSIHTNSIPMCDIPFTVPEHFTSVVLKGKRALVRESNELKELGDLESGNYHFHIGLDGTLVLINKQGRPLPLGNHPYVHPLQKLIQEQKERRWLESSKSPDTTLAEDYIKMMKEN